MRLHIANMISVLCLGAFLQPSTAQAGDALVASEPQVIPRRMSEEEITRFGQIDRSARESDKALIFRLMNLTGIVFRMYFCGEKHVAGAAVLNKILAETPRPISQVDLFQRWHSAKLQFSGNSIAVWREMSAVDAMKRIECSAEKMTSAREWLSENGG